MRRKRLLGSSGYYAAGVKLLIRKRMRTDASTARDITMSHRTPILTCRRLHLPEDEGMEPQPIGIIRILNYVTDSNILWTTAFPRASLILVSPQLRPKRRRNNPEQHQKLSVIAWYHQRPAIDHHSLHLPSEAYLYSFEHST